MDYSFAELDQLARLLESEAEGKDIDRAEARRLASRLAVLCPDIKQTMDRVGRRMGG